jgi:hypothetical protein
MACCEQLSNNRCEGTSKIDGWGKVASFQQRLSFVFPMLSTLFLAGFEFGCHLFQHADPT